MVRLATYAFDHGAAPALVIGNEVVAISDPQLPGTMKGLLAMEADVLVQLQTRCQNKARQPLDRNRLLAPVPEPENFLGVGLNYRAHAAEQGRSLPAEPAVFTKLPQTVNRPDGPIPMPGYSETLDYEGELGIVIGRAARNMSLDNARTAIAGYVIVNDISVRALVSAGQLTLGKGGRGHAPFGPWITTADEVADPQVLGLRTLVNGEPRQASTTADMHHTCTAIVAFISQIVDLRPGDVIATGSPGGSGVGFRPPRYLAPGDQVRVEIDGLGHIENLVTTSGP